MLHYVQQLVISFAYGGFIRAYSLKEYQHNEIKDATGGKQQWEIIQCRGLLLHQVVMWSLITIIIVFSLMKAIKSGDFRTTRINKTRFSIICPYFSSTFTRLCLKHLMWAAALVLHDLNDHSLRASLATGGLKTSPLHAGQLAGAPRWPHSQMAVSWGQKETEKHQW